MKFKKLIILKKIILSISLFSIVGGSISIPFIYNKKSQKIVPKIKNVKEIKTPKSKNNLSKTKNQILKIMLNIASNETKWNSLKKTIIKNIGFKKDDFSSSEINTNKLNLNYKIDNFEGIENLLYVIEKWNASDGEIKIFGHLNKDDLKVSIKPFLINGFLTKKQSVIKKIDSLNFSWVKSIIKIKQNVEEYSKTLEEDLKNIIIFDLQKKNISNIKIKIKNFFINKKIGKLSFELEIYYLNKKYKTINVVYDNLQKDIINEIKIINAHYLKNNTFTLFNYKRQLNYEKINFKDYISSLKKLELIQKNNLNLSIENKNFDSSKGHLDFEIHFSKSGYKTHIVKMFYDGLLKDIPLDIIKNVKKDIRKIDGITINQENYDKVKYYHIAKVAIKNYFKNNYPLLKPRFRSKEFAPYTFEYILILTSKIYIKKEINVFYKVSNLDQT